MSLLLLFTPAADAAVTTKGFAGHWVRRKKKEAPEEKPEVAVRVKITPSKVSEAEEAPEEITEVFKPPELPAAELLIFLLLIEKQLIIDLKQVEAKKEKLKKAEEEAALLARLETERILILARLEVMKSLIREQEDETLLILMIT